jgi:hypothetical protein
MTTAFARLALPEKRSAAALFLRVILSRLLAKMTALNLADFFTFTSIF